MHARLRRNEMHARAPDGGPPCYGAPARPILGGGLGGLVGQQLPELGAARVLGGWDELGQRGRSLRRITGPCAAALPPPPPPHPSRTKHRHHPSLARGSMHAALRRHWRPGCGSPPRSGAHTSGAHTPVDCGGGSGRSGSEHVIRSLRLRRCEHARGPPRLRRGAPRPPPPPPSQALPVSGQGRHAYRFAPDLACRQALRRMADRHTAEHAPGGIPPVDVEAGLASAAARPDDWGVQSGNVEGPASPAPPTPAGTTGHWPGAHAGKVASTLLCGHGLQVAGRLAAEHSPGRFWVDETAMANNNSVVGE